MLNVPKVWRVFSYAIVVILFSSIWVTQKLISLVDFNKLSLCFTVRVFVGVPLLGKLLVRLANILIETKSIVPFFSFNDILRGLKFRLPAEMLFCVPREFRRAQTVYLHLLPRSQRAREVQIKQPTFESRFPFSSLISQFVAKGSNGVVFLIYEIRHVCSLVFYIVPESKEFRQSTLEGRTSTTRLTLE